MARAHRHYIPGCVWNITHRCHKKEFLLGFARDRVEEPLARQGGKRESRWTKSIAARSEAFVGKTKSELGIRAIGREVVGADGVYELREGGVSYNGIFEGKNSGLRPENTYFLDLSV
jgi:hypothetical protein